MKKILVVLLILAVAGGVFAQQGSWSLSGEAHIGTRVDFDPTPLDDNDNNNHAKVSGVNYFRPYDDWSSIRGGINLGYTRGSLGLGLGFDTDGFIVGTGTANGENYRFQVQSHLNNFIFPNDVRFSAGWSSPTGAASDRLQQGGDGRGTPGHTLSRLWGEYRMLDGLVALEIAYRSRDAEFWVSDKTAAIDNDNFFRTYGLVRNLFKDGHTFTKVDRGNYLLANLNFENFQAGVMVPQLFPTAYTSWARGWEGRTWTSTRDGTTGELDEGRSNGATVEFVEDVIKQTVIGIKFSQSPVEVAGQFKVADYGIYFGGKFFLGPVTFGISFNGVLDPDNQIFKVGGNVNYNAGLFGAGVRGFYGRLPNNDEDYYHSVLGIEPSFFYNAIPSHLRFQLDAGFYFDNSFMTVEGLEDKQIIWAVQPQFFWNFAGTGAGSFWGFGTGMILRYRLMSDAFGPGVGHTDGWGPGGTNKRTNALDVVFKFSI